MNHSASRLRWLTCQVCFAVATLLGVAAQAGSVDEENPMAPIRIEVGDDGLAGLHFAGENILAEAGLAVDRVAFAGRQDALPAELQSVASVWEGERHRRIRRFAWGEVTCRYRVRENRLMLRLQVRNRSERPLDLIEIDLLTLQLGNGVLTGDSHNNLGRATVIPATWSSGSLVLCNEQVRRPLRLALDPSGGGRVTVRVTAGTASGGDRAHLRRSVGPGETDTYQLSLRFGSAQDDPNNLGRDIFQKYRALLEKPAMAVLAYQAGELDKGASDALAVALGSSGRWRIVERSDLSALLEEQSLSALALDWQIRLGRLAGADYLALITLRGEAKPTGLRVVRALTGQELIREELEAGLAEFDKLAESLRAHARKIYEARAEQPLSVVDPIALLPPREVSEGDGVHSRIDRVLEKLATRLRERHPLVHRLYPESFASEQRLAEAGFLQDPDQALPLLGARFLASFQVRSGEEGLLIVTTLTDARYGTRLGQKRVVLAGREEAEAGRVLGDWIAQKTSRARKSEPEKNRPAEKPSGLSPRSLSLLFRVISLHNQGRYTESIGYLSRLLELNPNMAEPQRWRRSCYRQLGFESVAAWIGKKVEEEKPRLVHLEPGSGIGLVGVSAPMSHGKAVSLTRLLTRALSEQTGRPVIVSRDIGALQREYDLLVGHKNTRGTTWRFSPNLTPKKLVTAELIRSGDEDTLRIYLVPIDQPKAARSVQLSLKDKDRTAWAEAVAAGVRRLLRKPDGSAKYPVPRPSRSTEQLARVEARSRALWSDYKLSERSGLYGVENSRRIQLLDRLRINPASYAGAMGLPAPRVVADDTWKPIEDWIDQQLPEDHPYVSWLRLYRLQRKRHNTAAHQRSLAAIAEQYPDHPAGLVADYKLMFRSIDPARLDRVEDRIAEFSERVHALRARGHNFDAETFLEAIGNLAKMVNRAQGQDVDTDEHWYPYIDIRFYRRQGEMMDYPAGPYLSARFKKPAVARMWLGMLGTFPDKIDALPLSERIPAFRGLLKDISLDPVAIAYARESRYMVWHLLNNDTLNASRMSDAQWMIDLYHDVLRLRLEWANEAGKIVHDLPITRNQRWRILGQWLEAHKDRCGDLLKAHRKLQSDLISNVLSGIESNRETVFYLLRSISAFSDPQARKQIRKRLYRAWEVPEGQEGQWPEGENWPDRSWSGIAAVSESLPQALRIPRMHKPFVDVLLRRYSAANAPEKPGSYPIRLFCIFGVKLIREGHYEEARRVVDRTLEMLEPWEKSGEYPRLVGDELWGNVLYWKALIAYRDGDTAEAMAYAKKGIKRARTNDSLVRSRKLSGGSGGAGNLSNELVRILNAVRTKPYEAFKSPFE